VIWEDENYFRVVLCSLLHDIGKFAWRCATEQEIRTSLGKLRSHEEWNKLLVRDTGESFPYWAKTNEPESICVWLGDWISAQERDDLDVEEQETKSERFERVKKTPLITSFSLIKLKSKNIKKWSWKHKTLNLDLPAVDDFVEVEEGSVPEHEFKRCLFEEFKNNLKKILKEHREGKKDKDTTLRELLDLLRRYLIYVPSASYVSQPDIDLFNHSKIACAISACLYKLYKEEGAEYLYKLKSEMKDIFDKKREAENSPPDKKEILMQELRRLKLGSENYNKKVFLLIKGDFSGIQDFISTLSTENAIRHLKSRSFYLALTNRLIPLKLVELLGLPETNIIFSDGGNFEILAPNLESTKRTVDEFISKINNYFWNLFGTKIFIGVDLKELSPKNFDKEFFSDIFKETQIKSWKHKKFFSILSDLIDNSGNQSLPYGKYKCRICHRELDEKKNECDVCAAMIRLRDEIKKMQNEKKLSKIKSELFKIGDEDLLECLSENINLNVLKEPYEIFCTGLPTTEDGKIVEFDKIGEDVEERTGTRKLAALKIDVDNLGEIFRKGLGKRNTLSLYSRLSFDINLFFTGIIERLRTLDKFKKNVYVIYSGGDDTFIIGAWDAVLEFAVEFIKYFRLYVNFNPDVTASGAYRIFSPKFPVKKIFELTENDLKRTKSFGSEKGKISLFGIPIKWDYFKGLNVGTDLIENTNEFETVWVLSRWLERLVIDKKIPRGLLAKIISSADEVLTYLKKELRNPDKVNLIPVYRFTYYLKRNVDKVLFDDFNDLWERCCFSDINMYRKNVSKSIEKLKLLQIACKIAQLKTRGGGIKNAGSEPKI